MEGYMRAVCFDEKILVELNENETQFENEVKLASAIWFYSRHRLTLPQAAVLAGLSVAEFMIMLGGSSIPSIDYPAEDLSREMNVI
jgi:predicted HTH domain antitoxin